MSGSDTLATVALIISVTNLSVIFMGDGAYVINSL